MIEETSVPAVFPAHAHNTQPISLEAFYAIACDPARSVALEASADAGSPGS